MLDLEKEIRAHWPCLDPDDDEEHAEWIKSSLPLFRRVARLVAEECAEEVGKGHGYHLGEAKKAAGTCRRIRDQYREKE